MDAGLDPASMGFYMTRMDSRVKHGNDREWRRGHAALCNNITRGDPASMQTPALTWIPLITCEIDAQISRG